MVIAAAESQTTYRCCVEDQRARAVQNALSHSRTAAGMLDSSSTAAKSSELLPGIDPTALAQRTMEQVRDAADECWHLLRCPLNHPQAWRLVDRVNEVVTAGVVRDGHRSRTMPASRLPYADPQRGAHLLDELAREWVLVEGRSSPVDAIHLAAFAVWVIDLYGHPFTDGCGKTATLISSFILARGGVSVPVYPSRGDFLAGAYHGDRMSWAHWSRWYSRLVGVGKA